MDFATGIAYGESPAVPHRPEPLWDRRNPTGLLALFVPFLGLFMAGYVAVRLALTFATWRSTPHRRAACSHAARIRTLGCFVLLCVVRNKIVAARRRAAEEDSLALRFILGG
jgi:hypothetical protein